MSRSRLVASLLLLGVLAGCGGEPRDRAAGDPPETSSPSPGASAPPASEPPKEPMDPLEQPVAERLAPRLADEGLDLEYVDCPEWPDDVPATLECKGYVDGVVGDVEVELSQGKRGRVDFDASLEDGVLATTRLVERLEAEGYTEVDCGETPAYPSEVGLRIVCSVHADGPPSYVVAEVTDPDGAVRIVEY
jgi:hypothetical protein